MPTQETRDESACPPAQRLPVTVVIPCYRCRGTIERALSSVANQTHLPTEVLLVDDCSGDETLEKLHELQYSHESGWIRVIALPRNVGPASVRNRGWDSAKGEFVAFLDADDSWHPQKLQLQWDCMQAHPETVLCGHAVARASSAPNPNIGGFKTRPISSTRMLFKNPIAPTSAMVRTSLELRFREGHRHMEDHLLWMEIALGGHAVTRMDACLAYQYKAPFGEGGLSAQLWSMEIADLRNYLLLMQSGNLGFFWLLALWPWSLLKFSRRLLVAAFPALLSRQKTA